MRNYLFASLMAVTSLSLAQVAGAQSPIPLSVEVRGGAAIPMGDFQERYNAETGVGFGANAVLQIVPMVGVYGGYERNMFSVDDEAGFGPDSEIIDQGFMFGAELALPFGGMGLSPWVRAGGIYNQFSREGGNLIGDFESERKLGFEAGAGISIPLGMVISITPGIRYRTYSPELGGQNRVGEDVDISYLAADVAMRFRF